MIAEGRRGADRDRGDEPMSGRELAEATRACPSCGFEGALNARYCRRCGQIRPIDPIAVSPSLTEAPPVQSRPDPVVFTPIATAVESRPRARVESRPPVAVEPRLPAFVEPQALTDLPLPAEFGSFTPASAWTPLPPDPDAPPDRQQPVSMRRCRHRARGRAQVCATCGGRPGPRIVVARSDGLGSVPADMSAATTLTPQQRRAMLIGAAVVGVSLLLAPLATVTSAIALVTALYLAILVQRIRIFTLALGDPDMVSIADEEARAIPASRLPVYTILVPAYREPEVIARLLTGLAALEYPAHKLDVKLLLEQDDPETYQAAIAANPGPHVEIIRVPPTGPKTKPKACVVGFARAKGRFVTIFDAEDRPEPLQLRRAVVAFQRRPDLACLQARLSYHNSNQNLITRWFTAEYAMWFGQFLPGLARQGVPVPLGGTSNHFRRTILDKVGGWDPHNVTEDADLGIRLHRQGYRTGVLDSITLEEANSDFVNWVKQRSRWYKGYLQTWLVHMRDPRRLWRELGPRGFVGFQLFVGGTPLIALLNPVFWALTATWFLARPDIIEALFPAWLYYLSLVCLVAGNFLFLYASVVSARVLGTPGLVGAALISPIYWVMMSIAAVKAVAQLVTAPSFWEKTTHGLDVPSSKKESRGAPA